MTSSSIDVINPEVCCICLEFLEGNTTNMELDCDHVFHEKCILMWGMYSNECPICRANTIEIVNQTDRSNQAPVVIRRLLIINLGLERTVILTFSGINLLLTFVLMTTNDYNTDINLLSLIFNLCGFIGSYSMELFLLFIYMIGITCEIGILLYTLLRYIEDQNYQTSGMNNLLLINKESQEVILLIFFIQFSIYLIFFVILLKFTDKIQQYIYEFTNQLIMISDD